MRHLFVLLAFFCVFAADLKAHPLMEYLKVEDAANKWQKVKTGKEDGLSIHELKLTSQTWRGITWEHEMILVVPDEVVIPGFCFLLIGGSSSAQNEIGYLKKFASATGSPAAALKDVPNQPLFDGRKEDALLAFTLKKYIDGGDSDWPILFPMVKSGVRAMDALSEFSRTFGLELNSFVVSGSSKRGWTTYLLGASDTRVKAIAPLVFDMLNMKAQTDWAEKVYGAQSEKIRNYTELGLIERISEPRTKELRKWIDPYEYREKLTLPTLILLGTNDPYWVVDAQRHYIDQIPGNTLLYQVANGGHHISGDDELFETLSGWYKLVSGQETLPELEWRVKGQEDRAATISLKSNFKIEEAVIWQAESPRYDFRDAIWRKRSVQFGRDQFTADLTAPDSGFKAVIGEAAIITEGGNRLKFSSPAQVLAAR